MDGAEIEITPRTVLQLAEQYCDAHGLDRSQVEDVAESMMAAMDHEECLVANLREYWKDYLGDVEGRSDPDEDMDVVDLIMNIPIRYCSVLSDAKRESCIRDTVNNLLNYLTDDCGEDAEDMLMNAMDIYADGEDEENGGCHGQEQCKEQGKEEIVRRELQRRRGAGAADAVELSAEQIAHLNSIELSSGEMAYLSRYVSGLDRSDMEGEDFIEILHNAPVLARTLTKMQHDREVFAEEINQFGGGRYFLAPDGTIQRHYHPSRWLYISIGLVASIIATVLWRIRRRRTICGKFSRQRRAAQRSIKRAKAKRKDQNAKIDVVQPLEAVAAKMKELANGRANALRITCLFIGLFCFNAGARVAGATLLLGYLFSKRDMLWSWREMTRFNDESESKDEPAQTIAVGRKKKKSTKQKTGKTKRKGTVGTVRNKDRPNKKSDEKRKEDPSSNTPIDEMSEARAKRRQEERCDTTVQVDTEQKGSEKVLAERERKQGKKMPTNVEAKPLEEQRRSKELLVFLESNSSCLKGSPAAFCQWLKQAEDVNNMGDLADAVNDDEFFNGSLKRGDGTVGVKGFKRNAFKRAVMAAVASVDSTSVEDNDIPVELLCPITHVLMTNHPVLASDGYTYEKSAIMAWFERQQGEVEEAKNVLVSNPDSNAAQSVVERGVISPITQKKLENLNLVPNNTIRTLALDMARE